jgi:hypothetical protein
MAADFRPVAPVDPTNPRLTLFLDAARLAVFPARLTVWLGRSLSRRPEG